MKSGLRYLAGFAWANLLLGSAACAQSLGPSTLSGPVPNRFNGHVYYLLGLSSWTDAQTKAVELGGNLVTINDDEECDWLYEQFSFFDGVPRPLWCGLTDQDHEGQFRWINGEPLSFLNWGRDEPNSDPEIASAENYVFLFPSANPREARWRDVNQFAADDLVDSARWATADSGSFGCHGVVEVAPANLHPIRPSIRHEPEGIVLEWQSRPNCDYQPQAGESVMGPWLNLGGAIHSGSAALLTFVEGTANNARFYRIVIIR